MSTSIIQNSYPAESVYHQFVLTGLKTITWPGHDHVGVTVVTCGNAIPGETDQPVRVESVARRKRDNARHSLRIFIVSRTAVSVNKDIGTQADSKGQMLIKKSTDQPSLRKDAVAADETIITFVEPCNSPVQVSCYTAALFDALSY